jgi:hypothetical protein
VSPCGRFLFVYLHQRTQNSVYYLDLKALDYRLRERPVLTLIFHDPKSYITVIAFLINIFLRIEIKYKI